MIPSTISSLLCKRIGPSDLLRQLLATKSFDVFRSQVSCSLVSLIKTLSDQLGLIAVPTAISSVLVVRSLWSSVAIVAIVVMPILEMEEDIETA